MRYVLGGKENDIEEKYITSTTLDNETLLKSRRSHAKATASQIAHKILTIISYQSNQLIDDKESGYDFELIKTQLMKEFVIEEIDAAIEYGQNNNIIMMNFDATPVRIYVI